MLVEHNGHMVAGVCTLSVTAEGLIAEGELLDNEYGNMVVDASDREFPWEMSAYVQAARYEELAAGANLSVNGHEVAGPALIMRDCTIREVSFTPVGVSVAHLRQPAIPTAVNAGGRYRQLLRRAPAGRTDYRPIRHDSGRPDLRKAGADLHHRDRFCRPVPHRGGGVDSDRPAPPYGADCRQLQRRLYLESSVQPGTVELPGYTDDGQGHLKKDNSGDVLAVDYEKGVIRAASGFDLEVLAVPAARYSAANYTAIINVDDTNQGTEWAPLLRPKPAPGATAVSFISGGNWYTLTDNGDYVLRDADGTVRGRVERSGSVLISLPAQPDVDSKIVVAWSPLDAFKAIDGQEPGNTVTLPPMQPASRLTDNGLQNIKPGTLRLGWSHNGSKSATDSNGALSGDVQGAVDYAQGIITLQNAPNAAYSVTADVYTEQRTVKQMALTTNADLVGGTIGPCQAGTVLIEVTATFSESESKSYWDWSAVTGFGQSARRGTRTYSSRRAYAHAISDDGNGGLVL